MALVNSKIRLVKSKEQEEEEKKRKQEEERRKQAQSDPLYLPTFEELSAIEEKAKEDAAAAVSSEKGLDFFQRPSNWDDGYQFGDVTKTALGTLGDVGVNAVKGVVRMGEGIGDAAQYGAAALADLFGADEKAEAIRQNAQRDKVTEAFSGVDEKLNKYSVLGRTSDAAAESLGQIGAIVGTAGLAGALGAGAVGTTAATTGLMGLSSFGSGTGEAYAAGADEGEAEAYGAIAGAADALSEMIFGGLGKGFKALGLSKGITSADDLLAKAVTSKIRNTLAKNAVQLGIKAGAEGLEEVLAGTMQAAGKKATYMSERDFADIIKDENLLEQFVVGAMASGISQTPSFVSATRAGVDLVSDGADAASDSAQGVQDKFAALRDKNADFGEIERTGLASGAKDEDIRMAGELSTALGKKIRFFREDAKNGTINNGEYHEDTGEIWINTRSKNVKAQIVAHELTHSIEKKDGYQQLVDLTMNKLEAEQKAKGKTLDDLYREKETLYADGGVRLASYDEITSELVAEYVEKRLLTDEASIKSLVSENRTLGQRIREWFDSLLAKMGNASAKEREYIRQMRDVYARALGEDVGAGADGVQHHISKTEKGQPFVTIDRDILAGVPKSDWQQTVVDNLTGKYPNGIKIGNQQIQITEQGIDEIAYSKQAQWLYKNDINTLTDKYRASDNADEIVRSAQGWINEGLNHKRKDDIVDFARGKTLIRVGKNDYEADVLVARLKNDDLMLYDIYNLSPTTIKEKETGTVMNSNPSPSGIRNPANISSGNSISQNVGNVNSKFSVSRVTQDSDGRQLSEGQQEYFRDSKVTDANGNLKVMYHGTQGGGFHVFDPAVSDDGISLFFTDRNEVAMSYSGTSETYAAKTFRTADDFNVFFEEIGAKEYNAAKEDGRFVLYKDGDEVAESDTADGLYEEFRDWSGLGSGDVNYEVYLNLTHPFEMDADGHMWNELPKSQFRRAAHIKAEEYEAKRVGDEFRLYRKSDGKEMTDGKMQVNENNVSLDPNYVRDIIVSKVNMILDIKTDTQLTTRYVAKWAKKNGYDGVIFKNIEDSGMYSSGDGPGTVAVAFSSEQVKSVANEMPTGDKDIRYSVSKSDDPDNKRVMPKRSAAGTKARARQEQQTRMRFEKKVMNRGFDNLSPAEQEHYRNEIVGQYRRKYDDYKKKRDALIASGYQFAGVDDYVEKVVGSVEDAAIDANTFLIHYQEGVFGDPARDDVQDFALDYLQMVGVHRPDTGETYVETQDSISAVDDEAVRKNTPGVKDAEETTQINEEIERVDPVTEAETDQTLQQIRNDIAADEAKYRELSDIVMSNERFNTMMLDEQNAILDEMQSLRERIDRANQIVQDMSYEQDMGGDVPMPGDESDPLAGVSSAVETEVEELDVNSAAYDGYKMSVPEFNVNPNPKSNGATAKEKEAETKKQFTREDAMERYEARKKKREERKTVAKAETAFKRLGYDIDGAIVDNYEDAQGIIEDNRLAAQAEYDVERYIKANNITPIVDTAAKMIATGAVKPTKAETGVGGKQLKLAKELAELYKQRQEIMQNNIREQGKKNTNIVNDRLDQILGGYDWYSAPNKSRKFWRQQLQLSLSNPEQVIRDVFGEGAVADELNDYIIKPTVENSARARRQTNQMVSGLRDLGLNASESAVTQIFSEYSNLEESGSKKAVLSESSLRELLADGGDADANTKKISDIAERIAATEYGDKESKEKKDFRDSIIEQFQNEINVNQSRARQRALREYKEQGGTNASWNALSEESKKAKIDEAYKTVTEESIDRIVSGTKELRRLLDDMYDAINQISVIHGAEPIKFRKGYMPHSHNQTEQLQKWFNDHMGGLNVTPVQDLPTDIAGKTADRKPNKRWFSHAQQRTGPRTTWDALGNIEDYLRIANDTIYHMDDIRKMRVLERYIRGIYSVARGATGEEQRARVRNDVMQRMHGTDDDLVFLGLKKSEQKQVSDEDMDLSQMTTFVTWLTNYTNDLAAKQIFNRDIESFAGRKVNNLANTLTSWSSRTMMQYNISSNLKQLSQLGTVSGDVGARISKDAAAMTLRSMQNLGNGTNELEQKYHISDRSTFLAEKEAIEEATFASDKDLTEKQKTDRQRAKDIWDYAWSMTDTTMSRYAVYAYFMEGMQRGMDDTEALHYADTKARNILASRMKGSSPLIFQSKNPILRMFTLFQREPLAAWQDILKTMPREYKDMKIGTDEKTAKEQITKRITGRLLGAGIVNTVYATVLGLGTPAMFDILGEPIRALLDKLWKDITPDEEDDITFKEMAERYISTLGDEIADDIPFANVVSLISNTYAGTEFESRLALNAPDLRKIFGLFGLGGKAAWNGAKLLWSDDAEDIELLEELSTIPGQIPVAILDMITEVVGTAAPAGNQIRKSAKGLIAVLRSGEYTKDGKLKYEVGGVGDSIRAVLLGSSNTRAGQEWIASGFESLSKTETEAYKALIGAGVSEKRARQYVERVAEAEKVADETQAQAEARMIDRMTDLNKQQKAELYYDMVATDNQRAAVDAAVGAGAKIDDAVETARAIRDSSKKLDRLTALQASDMDTDAREEMYLAMVAAKVKDADGNVIGTEDDDLLEALYTTGLDFDDFLDAKRMQSVLNANESLTANQRASRFLAWTASQGYTQAQADVIGENFGFSSGFRVKSETYQKIVDSGVTEENAVKVTDAIAGKTKTADKINAVWSTGVSGNQLDLAVKSVLSEKAYERYRIVVDANIPLEIYTWALLNADQDAEGEKGHGSVNNTERELILSQLALPRKDLSALWLALGGSEKSNPYSGTSSGGVPKVSVPKIELPKIELPKIELQKIGGGEWI